jgi:CSLREA domain-containing protein
VKTIQKGTRPLALAALCVGLAALFTPAAIAHAASLTVNTLLDDTTNGDGLCTLREAITAANNNANYNDCVATGFGDDTIIFSVSGTIALGSQLPNIQNAGTLTIDGAGQSMTISGNNAARVFQVNYGATLNLQNLAVTNGNAPTGGGINNGGALNVTNCTFSGNSAPGSSGGALQNTSSGTATIANSTFSTNNASMGGGIANFSALTIIGSAFSGNSASSTGGAVYNQSGSSTLTIINSAFSDNTATNDSGGISNSVGTLSVSNSAFSNNTARDAGGIRNHGTVTVANSTFSGNRATDTNGSGGGILNHGTATVANSTFSSNTAGTTNGSGGGIRNYEALTVTGSTFSSNSAISGGGINNYGGTLTITNSTFSSNSATYGGGIIHSSTGTVNVVNSTFSSNSATDSGGGIRNYGALTVGNTIIANSTAGGNCVGAITNGGNNLDDGATCGWGATNGSLSNTNPLLGALGNNGGPTQTMALLAGSPAINGVIFNAPNGCPTTDQRGYTRSGLRDIGAYEYDGIPSTMKLFLPLILR